MRTYLYLSLLVGALVVVAGCAEEQTSSCAVCSQSFTTAECNSIAVAAGCTRGESYTETTCSPAMQGCRFFGCGDLHPRCSTATDSGSDTGVDAATDAPRDPMCVQADNDPIGHGLFSSMSACSGAHAIMVNGNTRYTCPCGSPCPCGYQCGSISLAVGGTISSVCAPP